MPAGSQSSSSAPSPPMQRRPPLQPLSPDDSMRESFISTTSTTSFLPSSAPTPYNTLFAADAFGSVSNPDHGESTAESLSSGGAADREEVLRDHPDGSISIGPSITSTSTCATPSRNDQSFASSHAASRLLPSGSTHTTSIGTESIPASSRPVPAPLLALRPSVSGGSPSSPFSAPSTPGVAGLKFLGDDTAAEPSGSSSGSSNGHTGPTKRKRRKFIGIGSRQEVDRDTLRLRQLGYDAALGRDYTFWSSLSISWLNIGCIQGTIYAVSGAYGYGGPGMILIMWPLSGFLSLFLTLTLSELASAYPVSGAMASWAWKCARGGVGGERGWAWLMGGVVLGGHVGNILLVTWEVVNIITGTMSLAFNYHKEAWHQVLFFLAAILLCGGVGSQAWGRSHRFWLCGGIFGLCIWLILCISLLATGATSHGSTFITGRYFNESGWQSKPYVYLLGWAYTTIASGADASAHMAEETKNPSRNVPNAMTAAMVSTYVLGYISIVLLLLSISPDDAVTISQHDFPVGFILSKAVSSTGAIAICCLLIATLMLQILAQLQASSRFVFALARDNAMPFSQTISKTNDRKQPIFANGVVVALCLPFVLLPLGSRSALYSVLAVTCSTLSYIGYLVPAALYLFSKRDLQTEGRTSWSLRRWSRPVACVGVFYALLVIVTSTLPGQTPVSATSISWSPVVMVGTGLMCLLTWRCYGYKHYSGPIRSLTKWETGVEIDLQSTLGTRSRSTGAGAGEAGDAAGSPGVHGPSGRGGSGGDDPFSGEVTTAGLRRHDPADHLDISTALKFDEESGLADGHTVTVETAGSLTSDPDSSAWTDSTVSRRL